MIQNSNDTGNSKLDFTAWTENDLRTAFVSGATWWLYQAEGATAWPDERRKAEDEAETRYPGGSVAKNEKQKMTHIKSDTEKSQLDYIALIAVQYSTRVDALETEVSELRHRLEQIELCLRDTLE